MKLRFGKAKTIFAYIACLMVFLGVAEAYMRFKGYIPALDMENNPVHLDVDFDPDLGWAAMPGTHFQVGEPEPNELFTNIWHDGQRQSRWLVKRGGHKRVLLVGCSYTFGNGVRSTETYPWLLNERFPEINFDNFAFPAYGTFQALLSAEKHLKRRHYDLVIYAPFKEHINRNVGAAPCVNDVTETDRPLTEIIKHHSAIWYMPIVCLNRHHHLVEHIPYYEHWFLDRYSALSNTLKRLSMFYRYYHSLTRTDNADEQLMRQEIYWRLLWRMNDVVQESGSKLAVICLEDEHDKNHKLDIPTPEELAKMNSEGETLSFPPPFFYGFAGNGRNGEPDGPQFHVGGTDFVGCYGQMLGNPVPAMHKVWAENIAKMIPELIRNS